jgi:CO/xanthine dehydrogenase Mo-binding subunit
MSPSAAAGPAPRGFVIDRGDGRPQRPGSLHTQPRLSRWLSLAEAGVIHACTGKVELGQGILTALRLIVADELDVALQRVHLHSASTAHGPDEGVTSGSLSVQDSGTALRHACAELRGLALAEAARQRGCSTQQLTVSELTVDDGQVRAPDGHLLGDYWSLLGADALDIEHSGRFVPKTAAQRRLIGRAQAARVDLADKVFGRPRFIHDLHALGLWPGLRHGRVLRAPGLQGALDHFPPADLDLPAEAARGVDVWADGRFVAVVADDETTADRVADRLRQRLVWRAGPPLPEPATLPDFLRTAPCDTPAPVQRGDAEPPPEARPHHREFQREYFKPYLAHASIGPSCAVACWNGQALEVWTHSQGIHNLRDDLVLALSQEPVPVPREAITVHHVEGAGCYGHNGADDVALDAVLMALRCPGRPVRVRWSRADELAHSPVGPAQLVALKAWVDASGRITHWQHELWANGYSSRPGRAKTPTLLAASERAQATPLPLPINPPLAAGGGADRNAVPGYALPNLQVSLHRLTVMPLRTSAIRALGAFANVFAIESFIDEVAHALHEDPLAFRRRHLDDPRAQDVLEAVTSRSTWWSAHRPETSAEGSAHATGQGLAWARYKNSGAWCAAMARVEVGSSVRVTHLDLAVDVGMAIDPDGVLNQIEGGAVQATSWTLKEQVRWEGDRITSDGWESYPVLRFSEVPEVTVHLLDRPDEAPLGAGEAAQGPVAAAIANAVFNALGVRVRSLPLDAENLLRAVHGAEAAA